MKTYTADEVRDRIVATKKNWFPLRQCSICHCPIGYSLYAIRSLFDPGYAETYWGDEGQPLFPDTLPVLVWDPRCDCTSLDGRTGPAWGEVAALFNGQPTPEAQAALCRLFGFEPEAGEGAV